METQQFDLEPHEQLDEIDLRTNDDGSVDVKIDRWEKPENDTYVRVYYRTPTGSVENDRMKWPQRNSKEFKFIRFINKTPYTLRTAKEINEDDDLWIKATQDSADRWSLRLEEEKDVSEKIFSKLPEAKFNNAAIRFAFWPATVVGMIVAELEAETVTKAFSRVPKWDKVYLEDDTHRKKNVTAVKSALYTFFWIVVIGIMIL